LLDRDEKTIRKHINNIFKDREVEKENNTQKMCVVGVKQSVPFYSLDVIISVGYRVKSQNGVIFRKWATSILHDFMIKGYVVNRKRLYVLNKIIAIQSRMLASTLNIEEKAANLLYFLIKDHPFVDGGKRIGASIFLEFLNWITMAWMRSILQKNNIEYNKSPDNRVTCLMYMKCFLEIYAI